MLKYKKTPENCLHYLKVYSNTLTELRFCIEDHYFCVEYIKNIFLKLSIKMYLPKKKILRFNGNLFYY